MSINGNEIGDIMRCENKFCIYQSENKCILDNVSLDCNGTCKTCIRINLTDEELEKFKHDSYFDYAYLGKEFSKRKSEAILTLE